MSAGDREAAGAFVVQYGPMIRRRIRGKLRASVRRIADSQDILSTLGRRLDLYVRDHRFRCRTEGEFWSLIATIAERSTVDKARLLACVQSLEREDGMLAQHVRQRVEVNQLEGAAELAWDEIMGLIDDPVDRDIAHHWALGCTHEEIGSLLGLTHAAVRKRWQRLRDALREKMGSTP